MNIDNSLSNDVFECIECNAMSEGDCFNNTLKAATCVSETNECFTQVYPTSDAVFRGCVGKEYPRGYLSESRNVIENCSSGTKCNNVAIEFEKCYVTDYDLDKPHRLLPMHSMQCPVTHTKKGCYHYEGVERAVKGCVYEIETKKILDKNDPRVRLCLGDNCNSKHIIPKCLTCQSNYRDDTCLSSFKSDHLVLCDDYNDQCFIGVSEKNAIVRGCLSNAPQYLQNECTSNGTKCEVCDDPNGCNNRTVEYEQCYVAEFSSNEAVILTSNSSVKCPAAMAPLGCFHLEIAGTNVVKKGCVADFRKELHLLANEHLLNVCFGNNCNSELVRRMKDKQTH